MKRILLILFLTLFVLLGCSADKENEIIETSPEKQESDEGPKAQDPEESPIEEIKEEPIDALTPEDYVDLTVKPNEVGRVMVLMYHSIGEQDSAWEITPESFRKDLTYLYENDYRPISLEKFVKGKIDTPAGYTPVILTFDDGNQNNFNVWEENGEMIIDPDSAVGIMNEFNEKYEDFNVTATFYLYGLNPFRQQEYVEYKLNYLIENNYDIGNHTFNHARLINSESAHEVQKELAELVIFINQHLPEYEVNTFAIPYGQSPPGDLRQYLMEGEYDGVSYHNIAVLEVGSHPSFSVYDNRFDYTSIPRIRASSTEDNMESEEWFEYFEKNPHFRFVSDGYPDVITVPEDMSDLLNPLDWPDKQVYIYEEGVQ